MLLHTLTILISLTIPCQAQQKPSLVQISEETRTYAAVQGASSLDELGRRLHETLSSGSPDNIKPYLIDQQVYDKLLKKSPAQLRETLQLLSPENIAADFQRELATVVTDGIAAEINWAQTKQAGVSKKQDAQAHHVIPATLRVSDQHNRQVEINFEAVKVDDRFYFFQQVRLGN